MRTLVTRPLVLGLSVFGLGLALERSASAQSPATVQPPPAAPKAEKRAIVNPTRTAVLFGGLEREVAEAVRRRDAATLDRLVFPDFELLASGHLDLPVAREDWQEAVLGPTLKFLRIGDVSVRLVGDDAALVSFTFEQKSEPPQPSGRFGFVDLWRRDKGEWRLQSRYAAPAGDAPVPGWVAQEVLAQEVLEKR